MSVNTYGKGKYKVWLKKQKIGDEIVYTIGGGEKPHIGAVSVCEPGKKPKSIKLKGHYDYMITEPITKTATKKYTVKTVCVGGVHIDNATKEEIKKLVKNCKELKKFV